MICHSKKREKTVVRSLGNLPRPIFYEYALNGDNFKIINVIDTVHLLLYPRIKERSRCEVQHFFRIETIDVIVKKSSPAHAVSTLTQIQVEREIEKKKKNNFSMKYS